MKKFYIKITGLVILAIGIVIGIIWLAKCQVRHAEIPSFVVQSHNYSLVSYPNTDFSLTIYASDNAKYYFDQTLITQSALSDSKSAEIIALKLVSITEAVDETQEIPSGYLGYVLKFNLPLVKGESIALANALLQLTYTNGEVWEFPLGSFFLLDHDYALADNPLLLIDKMKPIVNNIGGQQSIGGIILQLTNQASSDLLITKMELLAASVNLNTDQMIILSTDEYANNTPVATILQEEYDFFNQKQSETANLLFASQATKLLFIPLSYLQLQFIQTIGLLITYEYEGSIKTQIIQPVLLFQTTNIPSKVINDATN